MKKVLFVFSYVVFICYSASAQTKAVAVVNPTDGNTVKGVLTFTEIDTGVKVTGHIEGLKPGKHGFHIHEFGDCSSKDGSAAGSHFNPTKQPHGAPTDKQHHIGDLGNIEAGIDGVAHVDVLFPGIAMEAQSTIIGRGVIVHTNADDLKSQPVGNAGGRLACGVIGIAKP